MHIWPEVVRKLHPQLEELAATRLQPEQAPSLGTRTITHCEAAPGHVPESAGGTGHSQYHLAEQVRPASGTDIPSQEPQPQEHEREGSSGGNRQAAVPSQSNQQASTLHMELQKLSFPNPPQLPPVHPNSATVGVGRRLLQPNVEQGQLTSLFGLETAPSELPLHAGHAYSNTGAAGAVLHAAAAATQLPPLQLQQRGPQSRFKSPGEAIRSKSWAPGRPRWQRWGSISAALSAADLVCASDQVTAGALTLVFLSHNASHHLCTSSLCC